MASTFAPITPEMFSRYAFAARSKIIQASHQATAEVSFLQITAHDWAVINWAISMYRASIFEQLKRDGYATGEPLNEMADPL